MKAIIKKINPINNLIKKGYLAKNVRKQLLINFLFQRIFRINSDCKYSLHYTSSVQMADKIKIGKSVDISLIISGGCYFQGNNGIEIGDNTIIAPGVKIISANHDKIDYKKHLQTRSIKIGTNCWIGAGSIILPGVILGNNTIVGAGSVVTKSFPMGNVIIGGNPARILEKKA